MNLYNIYTEAELVKSERDQLPDSSFGLPKTRQYPLHDAEHVRKAIQMFSHCPENNREELAGNIFEACKRFDVEISEKALVFKYLSSSQQKEITDRNSKRKELTESSSMLSFVEFYQFPLNEENIEKYGKDYKELSTFSIKPDTKGLILVDKFDQVTGHIRVNALSGYLKDIKVNPIYRGQGIGSKLLDTEVGKLASVAFIKSEDSKLQSFFESNGFTSESNGNMTMMTRKSNLNEDVKIDVDEQLLENAMIELESHRDIVTETESYLNYLKEASVAGVACVAPLASATIKKPFANDVVRPATKNCPNLFDYDEFYDPEESIFVCSSEANKLDVQEPVDVAKNIPDKNSNSSSHIKKPQAMMEDESFNEDSGIVGAIIWDIIKFIFKLPFKIGKFIAKRIRNSSNYKIDKAVKAYRKAYDNCLDVSKLKSKEISLKELCKELKVSTASLDRFKNHDGLIKVTAWYKSGKLVSYFIEILETKNSTEFEYVVGIVDGEYGKEPTKTLLCAIMEYETKSYGKYLERLNTILRKRGAKLLEETILFEDTDLTHSIVAKIVKEDNDNLHLEFFDGSTNIGKASLCDDWDKSKRTFLYNFEVKSELRGKGYGTQVMKYLIDKYRVKALNVTKDNKVAIRLYEKFGFKIVQNVNVDGKAMLRMERKGRVNLNEDIDATASSDSEIIDYKDQSTDVIVGVDRYTCHKDNNGCYYIKLNANEYEDESKKALIMPYLNQDMFITSDFHINHKNRNSANFVNLLVSEINAKVPVDGTLMICGDLGNKGQLQKEYISDFIRRLNVSKKILLLGNHDNLTIKDYYDMGFTFVTDTIETYHYIFSHCPVDPKGKINIHGHIHESNEYWNMPSEGHINVYIDSHDNKVYQLKDYLRFYRQGKYKGKSIKKKF